MLLEAIKINPQILANPAVTAKLVRMIGQGNPQMEGIADLIAPDQNAEMTPQQMGQQLQVMQTQLQGSQETIQKLAQALAAKMPEIESRERIAAENNAVKLAIAEIGATQQDEARAAADALALTQIAHEKDQLEQQQMAAQQAQMAAQQQQQEQQQENMPAVEAAAQPEPMGEEGAL